MTRTAPAPLAAALLTLLLSTSAHARHLLRGPNDPAPAPSPAAWDFPSDTPSGSPFGSPSGSPSASPGLAPLPLWLRDSPPAPPSPGPSPPAPSPAAQAPLGEDAQPCDNSFTSFQLNGGQCVTAPVTVNLVYYGNWASSNSASWRDYLNDLVNSLASTQQWQTVMSSAGCAAHMSLGAAVNVDPVDSLGTSLSSADIQTIITQTYDVSQADVSTFYLLLAGSDISTAIEGGGTYCGDLTGPAVGGCVCGYHSWFSNTATNTNGVYYGFVGYNSVCTVASVVQHELAEYVTDPFPRLGYVDAGGCEIGDKCEDLQLTNQVVGGWTYSLQPLWDVAQGQCI